jgi:hypothetical protein
MAQKGLKGEILKGITNFFDTLESDRDAAEQTERSEDDITARKICVSDVFSCSQNPRTDHIRQAAIADDNLKAVEGTVIVYILLAVKQDQVR